ncbi:MAG: transposase [Chlorobiaceae bacterium]
MVVATGKTQSQGLRYLRSFKEHNMPSKLCIGNGVLGFWKAIREVYPEAKKQSYWVHKTANVLDNIPKSIQSSAKSLIHDIYRAETNNFLEGTSIYSLMIYLYKI